MSIMIIVNVGVTCIRRDSSARRLARPVGESVSARAPSLVVRRPMRCQVRGSARTSVSATWAWTIRSKASPARAQSVRNPTTPVRSTCSVSTFAVRHSSAAGTSVAAPAKLVGIRCQGPVDGQWFNGVMADDEFTEDVIDVLRDLGPGHVVTYGEVAVEAGHPGAARAVGNLLRSSRGLPWWRVVAADGRVNPLAASEATERLRAEGVEVRDGRVIGPRRHGGRRPRRSRVLELRGRSDRQRA